MTKYLFTIKQYKETVEVMLQFTTICSQSVAYTADSCAILCSELVLYSQDEMIRKQQIWSFGYLCNIATGYYMVYHVTLHCFN